MKLAELSRRLPLNGRGAGARSTYAAVSLAALLLLAAPAFAQPADGPSVTHDMTLWLRADTGMATVNGGVAFWADQSPAVNSVHQDDDFARPQLVDGAINGQPAVQFDGAATFLHIDGQPITSQEYTIIVVMTNTRTDGGFEEAFSNWSFDNTTTSVFLGTQGLDPDGPDTTQARFTDQLSNPEGAGIIRRRSQPTILTGVASADGMSVYNGRQVLASFSFPPEDRILGGDYVIGRQGLDGLEFWNGQIAEILVYNAALSSDELDSVWTYLEGRYQAPLAVQGDLALWLRSDMGVTIDDDGRVSAWADQSGSGHDASGIGDGRPLFATGAMNGRPGLQFDQGQWMDIAGQVITSQQYTIVAAVTDRRSDDGFAEIFSNWTPDNAETSVFLGTVLMDPDGSDTTRARFTDLLGGEFQDQSGAGTITRRSSPFVISAVSGAADAMLFEGTDQIASLGGPIPDRNLATPYAIGRQGSSPFEGWSGDLAELLVYNHALSTDELAMVETYLGKKYGTPASTANTGVQFYDMFYDANYVQTSGDAPTAPVDFNFATRTISPSAADQTNASETGPGPNEPLTLDDRGLGTYIFFSPSYATADDLLAAYPAGTYTLSISGGVLGDQSGSLERPDQPIWSAEIPSVSPAMFAAMGNVDATSDFQIDFNSFAPVDGSNTALVFVGLDDQFGAELFGTHGDNNLGSVTIPAGTMAPGQDYTFQIFFTSRLEFDHLGFNGTAAGTVGFDRVTAIRVHARSLGCNPADIVSVGQQPPPDGLLTGDDYVAFINAFFTGNQLADIVSVGQQPPPDGLLTGDDYVAFINSFFVGCH